MKNLFLAKSNPKEDIMEHTDKLLENFEVLKEIYPNIKNINWELLELACIYHDLGKMNTKFQNKIAENINKEIKETNSRSKIKLLEDELKDIKEIPHGYLSNAFLPKDYLKRNFKEDEIRILYESIYYHHYREQLEGRRFDELMNVINEDLSKYIYDFKYDKLVDTINELDMDFLKYIFNRILVENASKHNIKSETVSKFIITKGLLNKIDFAASSGVPVEIVPGDLINLTEESIKPNRINELQAFMKENTNENLIVTASTGIGKTEGALLWIGNNKGFFTLPLRVSINSIYDRVISKIKYDKSKTALLHSDSASEYMKRESRGIIDKSHLDGTKQLSYPLTICTLDQLIGFIFKYEGFELKLATLSYSKIIIDEIQMYSPEMIAYLILALRDIEKMGGKFAIVTATFPPIFEYFMNSNSIGLKEGVNYKKPSKPFLKKLDGKVMLRHKLRVFEENINPEIIKEEYKNQKVLVIVNTVQKAQELYEELSINNDIKENLYMFHSRFIKEDRSMKEEFIYRDGQLENKFCGVWITTQVVEASLDIDFDVLYTELSDINGLLQRMGRVYRNRVLIDGKVNINVFVGNSKLPSGIKDNTSRYDSIIDIDIFNKSKEAILKYNNLELDELEKMKIIEEVYSVKNLKNSKYFDTIKTTINDFNKITPYDLKKNEKKLRDIMTETIIPRDIYYINEDRINEILKRLKKCDSYSQRIKLKNEISKNTLSISEAMFKKINKIKEIEISNYEKIYVVEGEYSFNKGYIPFNEDKK